jgi:DNA-binding beta-propeller fold protein YncE
VITFSARYVFTGNDDERYRGGRTVTRLDPRSGRLVGKPLLLGSPQSIAFGRGAVWVADHTGWLFKIDPDRFRVLARTRLRFGPHGVVVSGNGVYVAASHENRIVKADPQRGRIEASGRLPVGPIYPVAGAGALWSGSSAVREDPANSDDRLMRIDPNHLQATRIYHLEAPMSPRSPTDSAACGWRSATDQ